MNPQIPWICVGYRNKLLGAVSQTDYIGDLITRPAATQAIETLLNHHERVPWQTSRSRSPFTWSSTVVYLEYTQVLNLCRFIYNNIMAYVDFCSIVNCPALTVGRLVRTSPINCVTSQMKISGKCSFSCPRGYQLQGPSHKQCGANGQWTDIAKSVSCKGELTSVNCKCLHL